MRAHGGKLRIIEITGARNAHRVRANIDINRLHRTPKASAVSGDEVLCGKRQQFGVGRVQQPGAHRSRVALIEHGVGGEYRARRLGDANELIAGGDLAQAAAAVDDIVPGERLACALGGKAV